MSQGSESSRLHLDIGNTVRLKANDFVHYSPNLAIMTINDPTLGGQTILFKTFKQLVLVLALVWFLAY